MTDKQIKERIVSIGHAARAASRAVALLGSEKKREILESVGAELLKRSDEILRANEKDMKAAGAEGLSSALLDRLALDRARLKEIAAGVKAIGALEDPVGRIEGMKRRPNGMMVGRMRVPLGVLGVIYESRPNVTIDTAALAFKSGNAVILRGGKEAINSNKALALIARSVLASAGLDPDAIQLIEILDRAAMRHLLRLDKSVDLIVPRGGPTLLDFVTRTSRIPVVKHGAGVCHLYLDQSADKEMAFAITINSKVERPGVCNAIETLLAHEEFATASLGGLGRALIERGVEIRACPIARKLIRGSIRARESDWGAEYLDLRLAVKVVKSFDEAIEHIRRYGSGHTESIVTERYSRALRFLNEVDSSAVMVNASTRFNDGGQFGLGAEVGISSQKLHSRGPMGVFDLTSLKWIVLGAGQTR